MEVVYEVSVTLDGEVIFVKELTILNGDYEIIKQALLGGMRACSNMCSKEICAALDATEESKTNK